MGERGKICGAVPSLETPERYLGRPQYSLRLCIRWLTDEQVGECEEGFRGPMQPIDVCQGAVVVQLGCNGTHRLTLLLEG